MQQDVYRVFVGMRMCAEHGFFSRSLVLSLGLTDGIDRVAATKTTHAHTHTKNGLCAERNALV